MNYDYSCEAKDKLNFLKLQGSEIFFLKIKEF